ncbi:hypothetical protein MHYP_G00256420 [Metynnis hypsauchen]
MRLPPGFCRLSWPSPSGPKHTAVTNIGDEHRRRRQGESLWGPGHLAGRCRCVQIWMPWQVLQLSGRVSQ